ncbi:MAG: Hsp33 family molecular chaperone HslO [Aquisalimonadaceae bacterium]
MSASPDQLHRFLFEHANVRGELIHLDGTYREVLARRPYPDAVARLLGEAMAAAGLLSSILKFQGSLILQMQGKGPITMAVASASHDQALRAVAHQREDVGQVPAGPLHAMCTEGNLAITIDPDDSTERYQGIVALDTNSLSEAVDNYFSQSEQLPTRIFLACDGNHAAGLLLQRLPGEDAHEDPDAWNRAEQLAATIKDDDLLNLDAREIIRRLFHEEDIRLFPPQPMRFHCPCSRERIASVLFSLGAEEVNSIILEQGAIEAQCEFCGSSYEFDEMDVEELFVGGGKGMPPSETLH